MTGADVQVKAGAGVCADNLPLRFGSGYDAALVYDASADELTLQTKDGTGSLVDRIAVRAGTNSPVAVFNEPGADMDVRMEGDTDPNLLFLDASADRVGIGTAAPGSKLTVNGTLAFTTLGAAADLNSQALTNANIDSGAIDGTAIGATVRASGRFTALDANGGGSLTGTWSDLGTVTAIDINGGTVDGAVIGGAAPAAGAFTALNARTSLTIGVPGANSYGRGVVRTLAVGTGATVVLDDAGYLGRLVLVAGRKSADNTVRFLDLLLCIRTVNPVVIASQAVGGPAARTYTTAAGTAEVKLAMAADAYDVLVEYSNPDNW